MNDEPEPSGADTGQVRRGRPRCDARAACRAQLVRWRQGDGTQTVSVDITVRARPTVRGGRCTRGRASCWV